MDRTLVLELRPTTEQANTLARTLEQHTDCFNAVCREGFGKEYSNGIELHKATYYQLRALYPDLPSQLVCAARVKATEAVKSALTWKKKHEQNFPKRIAKALKQGKEPPVFKPVHCPHSQIAPIRYDARSYWIKWESSTASLATTDGRLVLPFTVPEYAKKSIGAETASADLCFRRGRYFLHLVVTLKPLTVTPCTYVIGVDLGMNRPAVTSTHQFLGERRWKEQERRIFRLRRKLQKNGSKSAKRHLKKLSGKRFRQRRDHDHVISKRIVQHVTPGSTIVLENLKNIRERIKHKKGEGQRRMHSWSFAQLYSFIAYKAEESGIRVEKIDPRKTSQRCSKCGHEARNNRRSQSLFLCRKCSYCLNADLNASYNIRDKYLACLASEGTPSEVGSQSSCLSSPQQ